MEMDTDKKKRQRKRKKNPKNEKQGESEPESNAEAESGSETKSKPCRTRPRTGIGIGNDIRFVKRINGNGNTTGSERSALEGEQATWLHLPETQDGKHKGTWRDNVKAL